MSAGTVLDLIDRQPADGVALRLVGGQAVTYGQLFDLSRRLAAGLKRDGFRPGDRVFLLAPLNARVLAVVLAVMRLGGVVVVADPGSGRDVLRARLRESDTKWLLISPRLYALRYHPVLLRLLRRRRPEIPDIFGVKLPERIILDSPKRSRHRRTWGNYAAQSPKKGSRYATARLPSCLYFRYNCSAQGSCAHPWQPLGQSGSFRDFD